MKTTKLILAGLTILLITGAAGAAPFVVLPNGSRVQGTAIRALANGDINLTTDMGVRTFPRGSYVKAAADKPPEYDQAVAARNARKFDEAVKLLEGVVARFRFLEWDVEASKLLGQVLLENGDAEGAVKAYEQLFGLAPGERQNPDTAWAMRRAMLQAKQYPALIRQLDAVATAGPRPEAARAQIMRGDIQLAQNNVELAALDYLRTAILFQDVRDAAIQGEAHFKAAAALEQLRDPRAKDLYRKVAADYGTSPYAVQAKGKI